MAKFAIALCILLVACGAQSSLIVDTISGVMEQYIALAQGQWEALMAAIENVNDLFQIFQALVNYKIQEAVESYQQGIRDLAQKYGDISSCISSNYNVTQQAYDATTNVLICANEAKVTLDSNYEKTSVLFETFKEKLNNVTSSAASCRSDILTYARCIIELSMTASVDLARDWITLTTNAGGVIFSAGNYQVHLAVCISTSGVETTIQRVHSDMEDIRTCVAEKYPDSTSK